MESIEANSDGGEMDLSTYAMPFIENDPSVVKTPANVTMENEGRPKPSIRSFFRKKQHQSPPQTNGFSPPSSSKVKNFLEVLRPRSRSDAMQINIGKPRKNSVGNTPESPKTPPCTPMGSLLASNMMKSGSGDNNSVIGGNPYGLQRSRAYSEPKKSARMAAMNNFMAKRASKNATTDDAKQRVIPNSTGDFKLNSEERKGSSFDDLPENEEEAYAAFTKNHKCYDLLPVSSKLVVFDTGLNVKKAFFALVFNGCRAAPLWDSTKQTFIGMLTISDFIKILHKYYISPNIEIDELEEHNISTWREVLKEYDRPFVQVDAEASLFDALKILLENKVHRLPVFDAVSGNPLYILTHKRILRYLFLYMNSIPQPEFMDKSIIDLQVGTYENVITVDEDTSLHKIITIFVENRVSAVPIVNCDGKVVDIYAKFDAINLAADKTYNDLELSVKEAMIGKRSSHATPFQLATCKQTDNLRKIIDKLVEAEVHRLVVVDDEKKVIGIVSLSDVLEYLVMKHDRKKSQDVQDEI